MSNRPVSGDRRQAMANRAPSEWWPEPERKPPAPEQDAFQRTPSEGTRRLNASVEINEGLWSPLAQRGGEHGERPPRGVLRPGVVAAENATLASWRSVCRVRVCRARRCAC